LLNDLLEICWLDREGEFNETSQACSLKLTIAILFQSYELLLPKNILI